MATRKNSPKRKTIYAFIDSQNLNLGVQSAGWKLDFRKFRLYLKNKYAVSKAYLFIGQMAGRESLYDRLQSMGYHLIFKPTTTYKLNGRIVVKGNVDAELVLYAAAKVFRDYDQGKLLHLMVPNNKFSKLLRRFTKEMVRINPLRRQLALVTTKKTRSSGRSKP